MNTGLDSVKKPVSILFVDGKPAGLYELDLLQFEETRKKSLEDWRQKNRDLDALFAMATLSANLKKTNQQIQAINHQIIRTGLKNKPALEELKLLLIASEQTERSIRELLPEGVSPFAPLLREKQDCPIDPIFASLQEKFKERAYRRGIQLSFTIDPDLKPRVMINEMFFRRTLVTLLESSLEATQSGCIVLEARPGQAGGMDLTLMDTGAPVPLQFPWGGETRNDCSGESFWRKMGTVDLMMELSNMGGFGFEVQNITSQSGKYRNPQGVRFHFQFD